MSTHGATGHTQDDVSPATRPSDLLTHSHITSVVTRPSCIERRTGANHLCPASATDLLTKGSPSPSPVRLGVTVVGTAEEEAQLVGGHVGLVARLGEQRDRLRLVRGRGGGVAWGGGRLELAEGKRTLLDGRRRVVDGARDGPRLPDAVAAVERLQLLPRLVEGLEQKDVLRSDERQPGGGGARVEEEDLAVGERVPARDRRLERRLLVALADGHVAHALVRQRQVDVLDRAEVLREDDGLARRAVGGGAKRAQVGQQPGELGAQPERRRREARRRARPEGGERLQLAEQRRWHRWEARHADVAQRRVGGRRQRVDGVAAVRGQVARLGGRRVGGGRASAAAAGRLRGRRAGGGRGGGVLRLVGLLGLRHDLDEAAEREGRAAARAELGVVRGAVALAVAHEHVLRVHPRDDAALAVKVRARRRDDVAVVADRLIADGAEGGGRLAPLKREELLEARLLDRLDVEAERLRRVQLVDVRPQFAQLGRRAVPLRRVLRRRASQLREQLESQLGARHDRRPAERAHADRAVAVVGVGAPG
mmetsp:Transcript_41479/g.110145  ORF Transcript_41479/g.110145 Transcript_41479/m.110145 type:complete len:537 (-) Transcript_41479:444-2054(-)